MFQLAVMTFSAMTFSAFLSAAAVSFCWWSGRVDHLFHCSRCRLHITSELRPCTDVSRTLCPPGHSRDEGEAVATDANHRECSVANGPGSCGGCGCGESVGR